MNILVINAGSSSVKYAVIDPAEEREIGEGLVERIGSDGACLKAVARDGRTEERDVPGVASVGDALAEIARTLTDGQAACLNSLDEIDAVGHRVVHGADVFSGSALVDDRVKADLAGLSELAPLHNPANLAGIEAAETLLPGRPHVAVFDTAFHSTIPPRAYLYGLPIEFAKKHRIRRYGFHGTSHAWVSARAIEMLGGPEHSRVVTAHIGNGVSLCAVRDGRSVDTTMGFTPLEGVVMGTRSGDVDPALVVYMIERLGMSPGDVDRMLNKESGLLGLAGIGSGDLRDVMKARDSGDERAAAAYDVYVYRLVLSIGTMAAALGGLDALVFTAGAGEHSPGLRADVCAGVAHLGVDVDPTLNNDALPDCDISAATAPVRTFVIATQEDRMIARETARVVKDR